MNARQIISQPIISEKSYALIAENKYTFRVHPRAHKTQIRAAVEEIFNVRVVDVRTMRQKPKPKRRGWTTGTHAQLEEGGRRARARRADRAVRGRRDRERVDETMPVKKQKPTSPARRFATWLDERGHHPLEAREVARQGQDAVRRAQHARADHEPPPRRRRQAPLPRDRLQAPQGRRAGEGRRDRVRPEPQRAHRAAPLRRRREALHPGAAAADGGDAGRLGRGRRHPGRQLPSARSGSRPAPSSTTSS